MRARRVAARLTDEALLSLIAALWMATLLLALPALVRQDGWLALVSGREIAQHGLPHHDTLTTFTLGKAWIDQQWLGQLAYYGAHSLGGLRVVLLLHAVFIATAFVLAIAAARWRGGSPRSVPWIIVLAGGCLVLGWQLRTQAIAYVLFVGVLWSLLRDVHRPSLATFAVVGAALLIWANVHGSVVLGAGLVGLRGVDLSFTRRRETRVRAAAFVAIALIAPFVSPYGLSLIDYYRDTLTNPEFRTLVTEWGPPVPGVTTIPFFALLVVAVWLVGRYGRTLARFERAVLALTLIGSLSAVRNVMWFALAALILLPVLLGQALGPDRAPAPVALRRVVAAVGAVALLAALAFTLVRPRADFTPAYSTRLDRAITAAADADPDARIFADVHYSDWILWRHPDYAGRVDYDARFELLGAPRLRSLAAYARQFGDRWSRPADGARILVIDRRDEPDADLTSPTYRRLSAGGAARVVYLTADDAVLVRTAH